MAQARVIVGVLVIAAVVGSSDNSSSISSRSSSIRCFSNSSRSGKQTWNQSTVR